jgi:hypothetical protein
MPAVDDARGNLVAAGAVLLAVAVAMLDIRLNRSWANGVHFIVDGATFAFVFVGLALRSPIRERPLAYQSTLALTGLALLVLVLDRLARILGADQPFSTSGSVMWMAAIFALVAAFAARRFWSLGCAVLAGLGVAAFVLAFIDWAFDPKGVTTFRWVLLVLVLGFAAYAASARGDGDRAGYTTPAVDVAGLLLIGLAATFVVTAIAAAINPLSALEGVAFDAGFGWKAVLIVGSLGVVAYGALSRERGPGWIGFVALLITIVIVANPTAGDRTVVGWPLVILLAAGAVLAAGLRDGGAGRDTRRTPREPRSPAPPAV